MKMWGRGWSNQIHLYISLGIVNSPESSETKSISDVTYFGRVNQYIKTNEQPKQQAKSAVSNYDGSVTDSVTLRRPSGFYTISCQHGGSLDSLTKMSHSNNT